MIWKYEDGRIYGTNEENKMMAEATFVSCGEKKVDINSTYVNPKLRGQGIAGEMLKLVSEHLREKGLKAIASCSYANVWLKRHKESYSDIISDDFDQE